MEQSPVRGMWGRYALFILFSLVWILVVGRYLGPRPPQQKEDDKDQVAQGPPKKEAKQPEVAKTKPEPGKEKAPSVKPAEKAAPNLASGPDKQPAKPPAKARAQPKVPDTYVTLGSLDPNSPYRMLVTFTNRGAAVNRIELNSPRFHDLEDNSGYMGHVVVDQSAPGPGCPVQVVGAGTPAQKADLRKGDVILDLDGQKIDGFDSLHAALSQTRPGHKVHLKVRRKDTATNSDEEVPLTVTLSRHPLEVVRPDAGAPPSLLMTLSEIDGSKLEQPPAGEPEKKASEPRPAYPAEIEGVDLRAANWEVEFDPKKDPARVTFRRYLPKWDLEVVKTFALAEVPEESAADSAYKAYHLTFEIQILNKGQTARQVVYQIDGPNGLPAEGWWYASKVSGALRDVVAGFRLPNGKPEQITFSSTEIGGKKPPGVKERSDPLQFIGVDAQYFDAMLIPQPDNPKEVWFAQWEPFYYGVVDRDLPNQVNASFSAWSVLETIAPGGQSKEPFTRRFLVFAGPKKPDLLAHYGLRDIVYYGWYGWVAKPLLVVLHTFYRLIPNYGVAIILLTVVVRGCMYPLSRKQARSAQKMQELQPEIKRIIEKYKNNVEARNKAQAELFRKHNFHPMGGCLLLFLQLPIFVGLYRALMVDIELRQAPLITEGLGWATNLAAPDMLFNWSGFWHLVGLDSVKNATGLLPLGPYFNILPILTIVMFLWQQNKMTPAPADEKAATQMRVMKYMMVLMGILFFKVASGLCVYFIASSLWSIAERKYLPKTAPVAKSPPANRPARPPAPGAPGRDGAPRGKKKSRRK